MIIMKRRENVNYTLFIVTMFRRYMIEYEYRTSTAIEIVNLQNYSNCDIVLKRRNILSKY